MMKDLDGIEKNIDKFKKEYAKLKSGMREHWERLKKDKDSHAYVNIFVEAMRISPYLIGHIDAVMYPVLLIGLIWALLA